MDYAKIAELQRMVDKAKRIVFFGGAGVSVESGIPDFRSPGGLYDITGNSVRVSGTFTTERVHKTPTDIY